MNRGLVIGIAASASVHGAVLLLFNHRPEVTVESAERQTMLEVVEMPMPEFDAEDLEFEHDDAPPTAEPQMSYAPPMLADVPSLVTVDSFIQPLQPPPLEPPKPGAIVIPLSRRTTTGAEIGELFNLRDLDRPPQPLVRVAPVLPPKPLGLDGARPPGKVVVMFTVDTEGRVRDPVVVESSRVEYEEPALAAALKWRFRPGRKDGRNVSTRVRLPFNIVPADRAR